MANEANADGDKAQRSQQKSSAGGARRKGREFALSLLFMADITNGQPPKVGEAAEHVLKVLLQNWEMSTDERKKLAADIEQFGTRLFEIYFGDSDDIDVIINELSHEWTLGRMPIIDRNILRLALAELRHLQEDVPTSATINEAVELAKEYGTPQSGKFVNGILGAYARREELVAET